MLAISIQDQQQTSSCIKCCCESVSLKPGETQPLVLNYAPWAVPIASRGLHCEPFVDVEEKDTCQPASGFPQAPEFVAFDTPVNTHMDADLSTTVTDPEGDPLTYKLVGSYGPKNGKAVVSPTGELDYDPFTGFTGADRFFVSASDGKHTTLFEVLIGVGVPSANIKPTPDLSVGTAIIDQRFYTVRLPISASPAAKNCQIFRLSIRQGALDCDCNCYYHVDCVDVRIATC